MTSNSVVATQILEESFAKIGLVMTALQSLHVQNQEYKKSGDNSMSSDVKGLPTIAEQSMFIHVLSFDRIVYIYIYACAYVCICFLHYRG